MLKNPYYQHHDADENDSWDQKATESQLSWPSFQQDADDDRLDHFIHRDGKVFAGTHLIIDLWGASGLDDLVQMEAAMRLAVEKSKATLLHIHLHHFTPNGGISGVAVLAESHISVHTWPEKNFAAFDVFMCGDAEPEQAVEVFKSFFKPSSCQVDNLLRGQIS
ncbi:adenosylmethionine decarboxylase [Marinicella sp. S1101]|uniref:adenosylmethionine decarboxylase n=1 Tax=Marinicella marina TaxID=2996016 RepID=UPI0022609AD1|nr:adenosylmethionine decarboxylase [Marinicella marina]MCX7552331.1 adenosylmethionine decarboxylase [Marinicella marina]MDJ1139206.1 adenosylmethionine decarboxylase [Marinicella marina]